MDWAALVIPILQAFLVKCWDKTSSEDPQEYLRSNYDAASGKFDRDVVVDSIPQTRRAVRKARQKLNRDERREFPKYSRAELYELTEKGLIESMNAPPEAVGSVRAMAAGLPDDDD